MNKIKIKYLQSLTLLLVLIVGFISCNPSVDLDLSQWGANHDITNVQAFELEGYTLDIREELLKYIENIEDGTVLGLRRVLYNRTLDWDTINGNSNITVKLENPASDPVNLNELGLFITHRADKVVPLGDSPILGLPSPYVEGKGYEYKLLSSDGSERVWTITVELE